MSSIKPQLLKIGPISGMHYSCGTKPKGILIYAIGAPVVPDSGQLSDAKFILEKKIDLFVPDYMGFGRSDGQFTPLNCIKTLLFLYDAVTGGCVGINSYDDMKLKLKYKQVLFVGKSLGGAYVPLLPKFNHKIQKLAIFYPAVDQKSQGKVAGEESNAKFIQSMKKDGYYHLYRGILNKTWLKHLENQDGLSPMDNIKYLSNARLFIAHGKLDKCIHYSKSVIYYKKILEIFPNKKDQFSLKLYSAGDHSPSTTNLAIRDCLMYFNL